MPIPLGLGSIDTAEACMVMELTFRMEAKKVPIGALLPGAAGSFGNPCPTGNPRMSG